MRRPRNAAVNVSDLKAHLSAHLAAVRAGHEVIVAERRVPFARIVPLVAEGAPANRERDELIRAGVLRPATARLPAAFWKKKGPRVRGNAVLDALLADRRDLGEDQ